MEALLILGVLVVGVAVFAIGIYNSLIVLRNKVDEGWADIDTQLKRRYDLIPNLVETVKGYATHEKSTFEEVTKARSMAMSATTPDQKAKAENFLSGTLKSLFALAENYPELKANENFLQLQAQLEGTENRISVERKKFNTIVQNYNTTIRQFPGSIIAGFTGFSQKEYFKAVAGSDQAPKVEF